MHQTAALPARLALLALTVLGFLLGGCQSASVASRSAAPAPALAQNVVESDAVIRAGVFGGLVGRESLSRVNLPEDDDSAGRLTLDQRAYLAWIKSTRS